MGRLSRSGLARPRPSGAGPAFFPHRAEKGEARDAAAEALASRLLYRDGLILVLDKPAGIPVHAGPRGGRNLEEGFAALRFGLPHPPFLAHRLDRDTSGCLVLGRHKKALRRLGALFAEGRVAKTYWAVAEGGPPEDEGRIETGLLKRSGRDGWKMVIDGDGLRAVTRYRVLGRGGGRSWLELKPETGRTHQIRVHCAALGAPVLGDPVYGRGGGTRTLLHAVRVAIPLYPERAPIEVTAPLPSDMREALHGLGYCAPEKESEEK